MINRIDHTAASVVTLSAWRHLGRLALEGFVTGLFVSLVLGLAVFIISSQAHAAEGPALAPSVLALPVVLLQC